MNVELIGVYPIAFNKKAFIGTMHIFLVEEKLDVRGIFVTKSKNKFFVDMPHMTQYDHEEKKFVNFPIFQFFDNAKHKLLVSILRQKALDYFKENWEKIPVCKIVPREPKVKNFEKKEKPKPATSFTSLEECKKTYGN